MLARLSPGLAPLVRTASLTLPPPVVARLDGIWRAG